MRSLRAVQKSQRVAISTEQCDFSCLKRSVCVSHSTPCSGRKAKVGVREWRAPGTRAYNGVHEQTELLIRGEVQSNAGFTKLGTLFDTNTGPLVLTSFLRHFLHLAMLIYGCVPEKKQYCTNFNAFCCILNSTCDHTGRKVRRNISQLHGLHCQEPFIMWRPLNLCGVKFGQTV